MNKLDLDYIHLVNDILDNGIEKDTRNGRVVSVFGRTIRHNFKDGFPLLTTKKMAWNSIVTELLWFLNGRSDLKWLLDRGNTIWLGDAIKRYESANGEINWGENISKSEVFLDLMGYKDFSSKWGDLGKIYGKQWRSWDIDKYLSDGVDQISNLIQELKRNPDSRRLLVTAWNPSNLNDMVLPPCHYSFQIYTQELTLKQRLDIFGDFFDVVHGSEDLTGDEIHKVLTYHIVPRRSASILFNMRSVDVPLGLPFNIASYALLLHIICKMVNMVPNELVANLGDAHIYKNQIEPIKNS